MCEEKVQLMKRGEGERSGGSFLYAAHLHTHREAESEKEGEYTKSNGLHISFRSQRITPPPQRP